MPALPLLGVGVATHARVPKLFLDYLDQVIEFDGIRARRLCPVLLGAEVGELSAQHFLIIIGRTRTGSGLGLEVPTLAALRSSQHPVALRT